MNALRFCMCVLGQVINRPRLQKKDAQDFGAGKYKYKYKYKSKYKYKYYTHNPGQHNWSKSWPHWLKYPYRRRIVLNTIHLDNNVSIDIEHHKFTDNRTKCWIKSCMESILVAQNSSRLRPAVWLHLVEESLGGRWTTWSLWMPQAHTNYLFS